MSTARSELATADERRRPRQANFGALSGGMIERGSVPAHILYGTDAAEAETPGGAIIDVNAAAAAAASLAQIRTLASLVRRTPPREAEPMPPAPAIAVVEQPVDAPVVAAEAPADMAVTVVVEPLAEAPVGRVETADAASAEVLAIDERVRPRQSNFGSLSSGMVERGSVPAHILYGSPLSAAQIELLLSPREVVSADSNPPDENTERQDDAGVVAAPVADHVEAETAPAEAVVETDDGPAVDVQDAVDIGADEAASVTPVEPIQQPEGAAAEILAIADVQPMASEPAEGVVLDAVIDAEFDVAAPHAEQPVDGADDTPSGGDVSRDADRPAAGMLQIAGPRLALEDEPAPALVLEPATTPAVAARPAAVAPLDIAAFMPPAESTALVPFAPAPKTSLKSLYVAIGLAEAVVLTLVCGWIAWRAPDPAATVASDAPVAGVATPAATPTVEQAEPDTTIASVVTTVEAPAPVAAVADRTAVSQPVPVVDVAPQPTPVVEPTRVVVVAPQPAPQVDAAPRPMPVAERAPVADAAPPPAPVVESASVVEARLQLPAVPDTALPSFPVVERAPVAEATAPAPAPVVVTLSVPPTSAPPAIAPAISPPPSTPASLEPQPAATEQASDLLRRGDEYLRNGDVATARLFYERGAETGDAQAMMALAQTYDPFLLKQLGARGIVPDAKLAERWYARAAAAQGRKP